MTSTTKRLLPVIQVDNAVIGNGKAGPITTWLSAAFMNREDQVLEENEH